MKTCTTVWCSLLLACMLTGVAVARDLASWQCFKDCAIFATSDFCDCDGPDPLAPASFPLYEMRKRGGYRQPFRFGKRSLVEKRQRIPFRYGKRSALPDLSDYNAMRQSAYDFPSLRSSSLLEEEK